MNAAVLTRILFWISDVLVYIFGPRHKLIKIHVPRSQLANIGYYYHWNFHRNILLTKRRFHPANFLRLPMSNRNVLDMLKLVRTAQSWGFIFFECAGSWLNDDFYDEMSNFCGRMKSEGAKTLNKKYKKLISNRE